MNNNKNAPLLLQKEWYQILYIENVPLLLKKNVLPQKSPQNDKMLYLFKKPPIYIKKQYLLKNNPTKTYLDLIITNTYNQIAVIHQMSNKYGP